MTDKEQIIIEQQQKTLDELVGDVSTWEDFTEEESELAKDSSIADLIMLLREKDERIIELTKEALSLKQECEELKKQISYLTEYRKKNQTCQECYEDGYNVGVGENKELARYRKALEEIEGFVLKVDGADECSYGDFNCSNCDDDCTCPTKVKRLILDIINKAKGENNGINDNSK